MALCRVFFFKHINLSRRRLPTSLDPLFSHPFVVSPTNPVPCCGVCVRLENYTPGTLVPGTKVQATFLDKDTIERGMVKGRGEWGRWSEKVGFPSLPSFYFAFSLVALALQPRGPPNPGRCEACPSSYHGPSCGSPVLGFARWLPAAWMEQPCFHGSCGLQPGRSPAAAHQVPWCRLCENHWVFLEFI